MNKIQILSGFLGKLALQAAPEFASIQHLFKEGLKESLKMFEHLNCILQFCPTHISLKELIAYFVEPNLGSNKSYVWKESSPED